MCSYIVTFHLETAISGNRVQISSVISHSLPLSITELPSDSVRERKWHVDWEYLHVFLPEFRMNFVKPEVIVES